MKRNIQDLTAKSVCIMICGTKYNFITENNLPNISKYFNLEDGKAKVTSKRAEQRVGFVLTVTFLVPRGWHGFVDRDVPELCCHPRVPKGHQDPAVPRAVLLLACTGSNNVMSYKRDISEVCKCVITLLLLIYLLVLLTIGQLPPCCWDRLEAQAAILLPAAGQVLLEWNMEETTPASEEAGSEGTVRGHQAHTIRPFKNHNTTSHPIPYFSLSRIEP